MNFITQSSVPCIAFINGEYWGVYAITEQYSDNYIENNYDIENNNVVTYKSHRIEDGTEDDSVLYDEMFEYIVSHDMAIDENYRAASEMLDMGSYQDYCALQLYICNTDSIFQWNNYQMWRVREPNIDQDKIYSDGKWRMMLYDVEQSLGLGGKEYLYAEDLLESIFYPDETEIMLMKKYSRGKNNPREMFQALWKNDSFKRELILSMCDVRNIFFEKNRALEMLEEIRLEYEPLISKSMERFLAESNSDDLQTYIDNKMEAISRFLCLRYDYFLQIFQESWGLSEPCTISIESTDPEKGKVLLNQNELNLEKEFCGEYFSEYPVTLLAIPGEHQEFIGWKKDGDLISTLPSIEMSVEDEMKVTAVFK